MLFDFDIQFEGAAMSRFSESARILTNTHVIPVVILPEVAALPQKATVPRGHFRFLQHSRSDELNTVSIPWQAVPDCLFIGTMIAPMELFSGNRPLCR